MNVWTKVCPERDLNPRPPITGRVWSPLHHQDNHAGNTAIEEVITWSGRGPPGKLFFEGDMEGEPITPLETPLRIKFMMHDRSHLSGWQGRILEGYRLFSIYRDRLISIYRDYLGCALSGFLSYTLSRFKWCPYNKWEVIGWKPQQNQTKGDMH